MKPMVLMLKYLHLLKNLLLMCNLYSKFNFTCPGFKIELNQSLLFRNIKISFYEDMLIRTKVLSKKLQEEINRLEN